MGVKQHKPAKATARHEQRNWNGLVRVCACERRLRSVLVATYDRRAADNTFAEKTNYLFVYICIFLVEVIAY